MNTIRPTRLITKRKRFSSDSTEDETPPIPKTLADQRKLDTTNPKRSGCYDFDLQKNKFYRNDKKLQMKCQVEVERLPEEVLKKHNNALKKSKEYLENQKFKRYSKRTKRK